MGKYHSCIKISSSSCLLNSSHSPANCFEAWPVNPQWDLALLIELAWSYRNISLLSIFEREICLFTLPPFSLNLLQSSPSIFWLIKTHLCFIHFTEQQEKEQCDKDCEDSDHVTRLNPLSHKDSSKCCSIKNAYSDLIISRGKDPKWQIPFLSSPPQNWWNRVKLTRVCSRLWLKLKPKHTGSNLLKCVICSC